MISCCPFNLSDEKTRILWEISNLCNMNCKHCLYYTNTKENVQNNISLDQVKKIVDEIAQQGTVSAIWLSGGEPLMRKDIVSIVRYINEKGIVPSLSTNGYLLTHDLIQELYENGVRYIHLSLDGINAKMHDEMRGFSGAFDRLMLVIDMLVEHQIQVGTSFMVTDESISQISAAITLAKEKKLSVLSFYLVAPLGRGAQEQLVSLKTAQSFKEYAATYVDTNELKVEFFRTGIATQGDALTTCKGNCFLTISAEGTLGGCPWYMKSAEDFPMLDLLHENFAKAKTKCEETMLRKIAEKKHVVEMNCSSCKNQSTCGGGCLALCAADQVDFLCKNYGV